MSVIAFIPARGGSKSIPGKNIKDFCGRPLIYWNLFALEKSELVDEVIVATDSEQIFKIVEESFIELSVFWASIFRSFDTLLIDLKNNKIKFI